MVNILIHKRKKLEELIKSNANYEEIREVCKEIDRIMEEHYFPKISRNM